MRIIALLQVQCVYLHCVAAVTCESCLNAARMGAALSLHKAISCFSYQEEKQTKLEGTHGLHFSAPSRSCLKKFQSEEVRGNLSSQELFWRQVQPYTYSRIF